MYKLLLCASTVVVLAASASTAQDNSCIGAGCSNKIWATSSHGTISEMKWKAIARRYYQSRLRSKFSEDNNLLNLWEVQQFIGFSGKKLKVSSAGNRQYWVWRDSDNPQRKIEATFEYYQLVDLKGSDFATVPNDFIKEAVSSLNSDRASQ